MTSTALVHSEPLIHDFIVHVSKIEFDFSEADWEEDFATEDEWISYQEEMTCKYSNCTIRFADEECPESEEEDETIEEYYEDAHCSEDGHYYHLLQSWIDENAGWCLLDIEYTIEKV